MSRPSAIERMISGVVRQLESLGEVEVTSEQIGEFVMDGLKGLDDVAFVRFASVYKNFSRRRRLPLVPHRARRRRRPLADDDE